MNFTSFINDRDGIGFDVSTEEETDRYYGYINAEKEHNFVLKQFKQNSDLIFLFGIGLGYELEEIIKLKKPNTTIIVFDFMDIYEFCKSINPTLFNHTNNVEYVVLDDLNDDLVNSIVMNKYWVFTNNINLIVSRYFEEKIDIVPEKIQKRFLDAWKFLFFRLGNDLEDGIMGVRNLLSNLESIVPSASLNEMKEFERVPAVCVASGPSVEKQIPLLKQIKDKVIIIAADSIYEYLRINGIVADFITVQERGEIIFNKFFKDRVIEKETILLSQSVVDPTVINSCENKLITFKDLQYEMAFNDVLGLNNNLFNGGSCANLSPALAVKLGCDPVILIGQDLSYSSIGNSHAKGSLAKKSTIDFNSTGYFAVEEVMDWYGKGMVYSNGIWGQFRTHFEIFATLYSNNFINATEGGSYINNWEHKSFAETLNQYDIFSMGKIEQRPIEIFKSIKVSEHKINEKKNNLSKKIEEMINQTEEIKKWTDQNQKKLKKISEKYIVQKEIKQGDNEFVQKLLNEHDSFLSNNVFSQILYSPLRFSYHRKILQKSEINNSSDFVSLCETIRMFLIAVNDAYSQVYIELKSTEKTVTLSEK